MNKKTAVLFCALALLLLTRFFFVLSNKITYINGEDVVFVTTLLSEPKATGRYQQFTFLDSGGNRIFIRAKKYPALHYGQKLAISGKLQMKALQNKQIAHTIQNPQITLLKSENWFLLFTAGIKKDIQELFNETLPYTDASLLLGIVFGIKDSLPLELEKQIQTAGVMHVVAASGMNVTMLCGFISFFLASFMGRKIALFGSIVAVGFYVFLAGFEPSIERAGIMAILAFSAQILGRQRLAVYSLFLTGYSMMLLEPFIIYDIGFQLSFMATAGLLYGKPLFDLILPIKKGIFRAISDDVKTTIVAQLATLPLLFLYFGNYSLWSLLVNALVLWTIPALMAIGGAAAILSFIFYPIAKLLLYLSLPFLIYFETIIRLFSQFEWSLSFSAIPLPLIIGYYCILFSFVLFWQKKYA